MALPVQQDVLRLQVAVNYVFGVEVLDRTDDLRGVEQTGGVTEAASAAKVAEQLAARHVVHQHIKEAFVVVRPKPGKEKNKL